jgi:peroxiredoxin Q/BCP
MTPGCTKEACNFRDNYDEYKKRRIVVIGISNDNEESHKKFAEKHNLPFLLLSDTDKKVVNEYGVYGEKSFLGKVFKGIKRTTFLIDEAGIIRKVYPKVSVSKHSTEILEDFGDI